MSFQKNFLKKYPLLKNFTVNDLLLVNSLGILLTGLTPDELSPPFIITAVFLLASAIATSVHNSEITAQRIGPAKGTLLLALSVTVIEVAFIINMMKSSASHAPTIARDAVFAALMILTNGTVGVSILIGGIKHKELGFQAVGTSSLMGCLATLSVLTMVLPNYTISSAGPTFNPSQLIFISVAALIIYLSLIWAQTISYKSYFLALSDAEFTSFEKRNYLPTKSKAIISFIRLFLSLIVVVGFAKMLSPTIEKGLELVNAPSSTVGIIIALLVLAPESLAALNSAKLNQLQTTLNLALGSGAASIALTIPAVSLYSAFHQQPLILGLDPKNMIFLLLTFVAGGFTFGAGRTTALHGIIHLVILGSYLALSLVP